MKCPSCGCQMFVTITALTCREVMVLACPKCGAQKPATGKTPMLTQALARDVEEGYTPGRALDGHA